MSRDYTTVVDDEGINYREIAEIMTEVGFKMKHSSVHNYVIKVMKKFVIAVAAGWEIDLTDDRIDAIARSPEFQASLAEILQRIDVEGLERKT